MSVFVFLHLNLSISGILTAHFKMKIFINFASREELLQLPTIGEMRSKTIISFRDHYGFIDENILKQAIGQKPRPELLRAIDFRVAKPKQNQGGTEELGDEGSIRGYLSGNESGGGSNPGSVSDDDDRVSEPPMGESGSYQGDPFDTQTPNSAEIIQEIYNGPRGDSYSEFFGNQSQMGAGGVSVVNPPHNVQTSTALVGANGVSAVGPPQNLQSSTALEAADGVLVVNPPQNLQTSTAFVGSNGMSAVSPPQYSQHTDGANRVSAVSPPRNLQRSASDGPLHEQTSTALQQSIDRLGSGVRFAPPGATTINQTKYAASNSHSKRLTSDEAEEQRELEKIRIWSELMVRSRKPSQDEKIQENVRQQEVAVSPSHRLIRPEVKIWEESRYYEQKERDEKRRREEVVNHSQAEDARSKDISGQDKAVSRSSAKASGVDESRKYRARSKSRESVVKKQDTRDLDSLPKVPLDSLMDVGTFIDNLPSTPERNLHDRWKDIQSALYESLTGQNEGKVKIKEEKQTPNPSSLDPIKKGRPEEKDSTTEKKGHDRSRSPEKKSKKSSRKSPDRSVSPVKKSKKSSRKSKDRSVSPVKKNKKSKDKSRDRSVSLESREHSHKRRTSKSRDRSSSEGSLPRPGHRSKKNTKGKKKTHRHSSSEDSSSSSAERKSHRHRSCSPVSDDSDRKGRKKHRRKRHASSPGSSEKGSSNRRRKSPSEGSSPRRRRRSPSDSSEGSSPHRKRKGASKGSSPNRRRQNPSSDSSEGSSPRRNRKSSSKGRLPRRHRRSRSRDSSSDKKRRSYRKSPSDTERKKKTTRHHKKKHSTHKKKGHRSPKRDYSSSESSYSDSSSDEEYGRHGNPRKQPKNLKFDGKTSWRSFKYQFDSYRDVNRWSSRECRDYLTWSLVGKALDFFTLTMQMGKNLSFSRIMKKLESRFGEKELPETSRAKFQQASQNQGELLEDWADRVMTLATPAFKDLSEKRGLQEAIARFCQGCLDREAGKHACFERPRSMQQALDIIRHHQYISSAVEGKKPGKNRQEASVNAVGEDSETRITALEKTIEYLKGQLGKTRYPDKAVRDRDRNVCFFCKKPGHFRARCEKYAEFLKKSSEQPLNGKGPVVEATPRTDNRK